MKKNLFAFLLVFSLFNMLPSTQIAVQADPVVVVRSGDDGKDEVVAYSDSVVEGDDDIASLDSIGYTDDVLGQKIERVVGRWVERLASPGATILAFLVTISVFLFLFAPFIILLLLIRYFIKKNNARVKLAEKAMETGQPIPDELRPIDRQSSPYLRQRGIRNIALGLGLLVMFSFWGSSTLQGVGALIAIYGFGQFYLSRTPESRNDEFVGTKKNDEERIVEPDNQADEPKE